MRIKSFILFLIVYLISYRNYAYCSGHEEIYTSQGRVFVGLTEEEALERFGLPAAVSEGVWAYADTEKLFVYFSAPGVVNLYPKFCNSVAGIPLELKAFICLPSFKIKDITEEVELLISKPQDFLFEKSGVIIPKKEGDYQAIGKYKDIFSNPVYLKVQKAKEKEKEKEKLLNIDVLPYRPKVPVGSHLRFTALGTFFNYSDAKYYVRDLSEEALWFVQQDENIKQSKDSDIVFSSTGICRVFCKYKDAKSFSQEVEVQEAGPAFKQTLKHIILLPDFIISSVGNIINIRAFGTYHNNRIEEITSRADWDFKDSSILEIKENGYLNPKSEGITEISADFDEVKSLPIKIVIAAKGKTHPDIGEIYKPKEMKDESKNLTEEIKSYAHALSEDILREKAMLKSIKIMPEFLQISLGGKGELSATGIYSDNSERNLTKVAKWISSHNEIVVVSKGMVSTVSVGKVNIYAEFQGLRSMPVMVVVEDPELVSIALSPQNSKISMSGKLQLKAEGYFTDSSHKDITSLVAWNISGAHIIKIEKGSIKPVKFGQTKVYAEYAGVKSLPVGISVVVTMDYLLWMILKGVLILISVIISVFLILYILTIREKKKMMALYERPKEFIIAVYENLKKILTLFDLKYEESLAPLTYARIIENELSIDNRIFLRFTCKFEEAKYSQHILQSEDASLVLNDYNSFLKPLFGKYRKFSLFLRYCLTLLHKRPLLLS